MRKVILYIAMSLDGYIADAEGKVDWLTGQDSDLPEDGSYEEFEKEIDTVIMGWKTYHQIVTELSPKEWVYGNLQSYVITHRKAGSEDGILFTSQSPGTLVRELKEQKGKDIWICGGANLVRQLVEEDLIDQYRISVIPTILGKGIPLFGTMEKEIRLRLMEAQGRNGITELIYERR